MADVSPSALPVEASLAPEPPISPDVVGKLQAEGEQNYQGAVARGSALAAQRTANGAPPPPSTDEAAAPIFHPNSPHPAPPKADEAAAPAGEKPAPKPVKVTGPTQAEIDAANHEPDVGDFLHALVQGSVPEITSAPGQLAAGAAHTIAMGAGAVAQSVDKFWDAATGTGTKDGSTYHTGAEDAVLNFDKDFIKPAIEHWTPKKGSFIGDEGSGAVAQGMGGGAQMLAAMPFRSAGAAVFITNAFSKSATDNIDEGMDTKTAMINATLDAGAAGAQMLIIGKDFLKGQVSKLIPTALIRRVLSGIGAGDLIEMGKDLTKKYALEQSGNHKAAEKVDVLGHVTNLEEAVQNAVYAAVFPHAPKLKESTPGAPAPPPVKAAAAPDLKPGEGEPPPPPAGPAAAPAPPQAPAHSVVPDQPSAEPAKQIRAQLIDMNRTGTPRMGVLISPETQAHLDSVGGPEQSTHAAVVNNQIRQAKNQGRTVDTPAGLLVTKTKGAAAQARAQLKAGTDPQAVVGRFTGAGEGKSPDQTVVIQGREITDGSITAEKAVRPDQKGAAQQAMLDQGKVPVEVTPEGVLAGRHVGVTEEKQATKEPAKASEVTPHAEDVPKEISVPTGSQEPVTEPKVPVKAQEGMFKTDSGKEVPVHIAGEPVDGKLTVHPLNEEGEPGAGVQVPAERVRTGTAPKEELANEEVLPTKGTALDQLPAALAAHEKQETASGGRKNAAKLQERQDNASAFAGALKAAAKEAHEKKSATEPAIDRANEAANRAIRLTEKSKEATDKGQGTGHALVTGRVSEMHKAARDLMGKAKPGDEERTIERKPVKPVKPLVEKKPWDASKSPEVKRPPLVQGLAKGHWGTEEIPGVEESQAIPGEPAQENRVEPVSERMQQAEKDSIHRKKKLLQDTMQREAQKPLPVEKPRNAGEKDTQRFNALRDRYLNAETPEKARAAADELERHILDVAQRMGQENPQEIAAGILRHLSTVREDVGQRPTGRLSDTVEAEGEEHEFERPETGFRTTWRPNLGGKARERVWAKVTEATRSAMYDVGMKLKASGFMDRMLHLQDSGLAISYHKLLDELAKHAQGHLADMIRALREHVPDVPVFSRSTIIDPQTRKAFADAVRGGLYPNMRQMQPEFARQLGVSGELPAPMMQIKFQDTLTHSVDGIVHTIIHEGWHAASEYELQRNPTGKFALEMKHALDILRDRLSRKYGRDVINKHIEFFRGGERPDAPQWHLYGLTSPSEMLAEMGSNEHFMEEVIKSESEAHPDEGIPKVKGIPSLLHKVVASIARLLGVKDPALMMHIIDASMRVAGAQRAKYPGMYGDAGGALMNRLIPPHHIKALAEPGTVEDEHIGLMAAIKDLESMLKPAPTVKGEGQMRAMIGNDEAVEAARDNVHALRSGAVDIARKTVMSLKTVGQIFRDNIKAFGHDDDTNPINQLRGVMGEKNKLMQQMRKVSNPVAKAWMRLNTKDNMEVSQLMIDSTMYKIDPRQGAAIPADAQARQGFAARLAEYQSRYSALSDEARSVYDGATDANKQLRGMERRSAVDAAAEGFGLDLSDDQKRLLYGAKDTGAFERLIGEGKLVDVGDKNEKLRDALKDWVGSEMAGPYHHLGRQGEYVVQATPEGTKEFGNNKAKAEEFAARAKEMSPNSSAKAEERGGQWVVDYKVEHVSMHRTRAEAEKAQGVLRDSGFDAGKVTQKTYGREQAASLSTGMRELMTESIRRITRGGQDKGTDALTDSLHNAYLQMQAQRSAYAGSRLMRKNVGGVKAKDMRQNFAEHASSSIWHAAQVRTVFRQAVAMSRLREMTRDSDATQAQAYRRGEVVSALNSHAASEVNSMSSPFNAMVAKTGFLAYLSSPAHAAIWLTQNFTTGIPWAGARYGYGRSTAAFARGMAATTGPAMRQMLRETFSRNASGDEIHEAVVRAVAAHPEMGKWADAIRQLGERGVINHGYANELGELARGTSPNLTRVMEWARLQPAMADAINRVSTALAGLELTGGDLRKTADMVEAIHADYSGQNKPLAFKALRRVPGGPSIAMFKTYAQEMIHMTYGNLIAAMKGLTPGGEKEAAWVGAKTVAGLIVGNAMFAGVYGAVALEPIRFMIYAYHKLFDEEGEVWDLKNAVHHFLVDSLGASVGNAMARGPIAAVLGVDVQSRMGLANLFFHEPPDLLTADPKVWSTFIANELGPATQLIAQHVQDFVGHIQDGDYGKAVMSVIPIKVWQDGLKALQLMNTGKENSRGAHVTQPSGLDAMKQLFGLKPAAVADEQEKAGVKAEYKQVQGKTKGSIIKELLSHPEGSPEREEARQRLRAFNARNQGAGITGKEIKRDAISKFKTEHDVPTRNQRAEKAANFSGT